MMRINRLPILASVLLLAACAGDTLSPEQQTKKAVPQAQTATDTRLVHYRATVGNGDGSGHTRASLNTDGNYVYSAADMLYIRSTGEDAGRVYGALVLNSQDAGKSSGVTFEGNLHLVGYGANEEPSADMPLEAILVGPNDQLYTTNSVGDQIVDPITWPQDGALTATLAQAVERYSTLTAQSTYGEQSFNLSQGSSFIEFSVTLDDNTAVNTPIGAYVWTDAQLTGVRSGTVTTVDDGEGHIKANFVATFPGGTELNGAVVGLGLRNAITFGGTGTTTLAANKTYHVNRTFTKKPATISFNKTSLVKSNPDQAFTNPLTNTGKGDETVTYVSSNLAVATVVATGENAGRVTIVGPGTARITATVEDGVNFAYSEHDAYYDLTVYDPVPLASVTNEQVGWVIGTNGTDYGNAYVTISGVYAASKTPVAVVGYVGQPGTVEASSTDTNTGFRGLAVALSEAAASATWCSDMIIVCTASPCDGTIFSEAVASMTGIENTDLLAGHESQPSSTHTHAAATAVKNYNVTRPSGASTWFLPSTGQWFKVLGACGVATNQWTSYGNCPDSTGKTTQDLDNHCADNYTAVQRLMAAAGGTLNGSYWTSTERITKMFAFYVGFGSSYGVEMLIAPKYSTYKVLPFFAF